MNRLYALLLCGIVPAVFCATEGPTFDVASVKISGPETQQPYIVTGGPGTSAPGRFHGPHMTMTSLLTRAFGVGSDQIQGPKWLTDFSGMVYYNVNATMPPGTTKEEFQKMLQNLLIERFHLAVRRETRNFPGYDLVVDKGGPKFHEVTPEPSPGAVDSRTMVRADRGADGFPITTGPRTMSRSTASGMQRTKYQERSMAEFVSNLGFLIVPPRGRACWMETCSHEWWIKPV